jgi:tRNA threonylcarbamoyladenosine biosynthesis protein TsaE
VALKKEINIEFSIDELNIAAKKLLELEPSCRVFLFNGEMGSGKTTLIKSLCRHLGSSDEMSSPTFSLVNEYDSSQGKIYHMDLYRIEGAKELSDFGLEEYLDSGNYCFIEWPQIAMSRISSPYVKVELKAGDKIHYLCAGYFS